MLSHAAGEGAPSTLTTESVSGLNSRLAAAWARDRDKTAFENAWLDRFLQPLPQNPSMLDMGCGCAEPIARDLIASGYSVVGVESSPETIALCRA